MEKGSAQLVNFSTFGELLRYLRKRAQLSQRELAIATGYSESQISRLEGNLRSPNQADLLPLFVPALGIQDEPDIIQRLIGLTRQRRSYTVEKSSLKGIDSKKEPYESLISLEKAHLNNLPIQLTSFIGREKEIVALQKYIIASRTRLVTLTGSGGVGKTRLAIRVAEDLPSHFEDGVWLVELAPIANADRLSQTIAAVLGLKESSDLPIGELLFHYLRNRNLLLVLDNCEHLVDACAEMVDRLLRLCPRLVILATSREALQVAGEQTYRVPSLAVPDLRGLPPIEELSLFEAIGLFSERAAAVWHDFEITAENAPAVIEICRRLDGLPLAIELAASRVGVMSPEQIQIRLGQCFSLLSSGPRTALSRNQTLHASIDWSYNLLNSAEQLLFKRLSVFSGSWTLEAAEGVCGFDGIDSVEVLNVLASLVNKSLVSVIHEMTRQPDSAPHRNTIRYYMLETIRQYAAEKLANEDRSVAHSTNDLKRHFLTYYARLFEPTGYELLGPRQIDWVELLISELENIRAALNWAFTSNMPEIIEEGIKLASAPMYFWYFFGLVKEANSWLSTGLACLTRQANPSQMLMGKTYKTIAACLFSMGDLQKSKEYFRKSIALLRPLGPSYDLADALIWMVFVGYIQPTEAEVLGKEAVEVARQVGDAGLLAICLWIGPRTRQDLEEASRLLVKHGEQLFLVDSNRTLGLLAQMDGNYALAHSCRLKTLELNKKYSMKMQIAWDLRELAELAYFEGNYSLMESDAKECLYAAEEIRFWKMISWAQYYLGVTACRQNRPEQASQYFKESLAVAKTYYFDDLVLNNLVGLAGVAFANGQLADAVKLLGTAGSYQADRSRDVPQAEFIKYRGEVRLQLTESEFQTAWSAGQAMTIDQAVQLALKV